MSQTAAGRAAATGYAGTFPGRPDQVQRARHQVARYLAGHPVTALISREPSLEEIFLHHYDGSDGRVGG